MKRQFKLAVLLCCTLSFSASYAWKTVTLTKVSSLGTLAEQYRPQGVKQMDMVIAIRTANPRVFANLSDFKPGVKLLIPTNAVEVRSAIKGKYPAISGVSPALQKSTATASNANALTNNGPAASAAAPTKPSSAKAVAAKAQANSKAQALTKSAALQSASNKATTKATSANASSASKAASLHQKNASVQNVSAASANTASSNVASSANSSAVNNPKFINKTSSVSNSGSLDLVSSASMKSLQDTVTSQTQAIQSYQAQITDLNNQLGAANAQMQELQDRVNASKIWNVSNLGWALWALTLGAFVLQSRKSKQLAQEEIVADDEVEENELDEEEATRARIEEEQCEFEYEPQFHEVKAGKNKAVAMEAEPQVTKAKNKNSANQKPNWEQVELDIPAVASTTTEEFLGAKVEVDHFEDKTLAGEQQDIMSALENDQDNLDWHKALLEFYIKTNSHNGFKRHYQMMMQTGLMREGDVLWEEVRKMYLNSWVYPGFSS